MMQGPGHGSPYLGEIRIFGGNFAPVGYEFCVGQELLINDYPNLFSLLGTTYGGNGTTTFKLPDLRCRAIVHKGTMVGGSTYELAQTGGAATVLLSIGQMATHHHSPACSTQKGYLSTPTNAVWAVGDQPLYSSQNPNVNLAAGLVGSTGGNQAHNNIAPVLGINFIIAMTGTFPSPG